MTETLLEKPKKMRFPLIDAVRGLCISGMVIYHALFDVVEVFGYDVDKFTSFTPLTLVRDIGAGLFVFISGVCFHFSHRRLRRFTILFAGGLAVDIVTRIVAPDTAVLFGILTFMSVSGLLLSVGDRFLSRLPPRTFFGINVLLFAFFFRMNYAYIGTYSHVFFYMPLSLYRNYITAFFGFPFDGFSAGDYFPLFPWMFACLAGYFFFNACKGSEKIRRAACMRIPVFPWLGRHSLVIYIAHQPVLYGAVWLAAKILGK